MNTRLFTFSEEHRFISNSNIVSEAKEKIKKIKNDYEHALEKIGKSSNKNLLKLLRNTQHYITFEKTLLENLEKLELKTSELNIAYVIDVLESILQLFPYKAGNEEIYTDIYDWACEKINFFKESAKTCQKENLIPQEIEINIDLMVEKNKKKSKPTHNSLSARI